ncbi:ATP-dependent Clp protease adaptor protein ClpS [Nostocoides japonicum T1-X7]|uniref:ATP-dependent Clp protease adaptor protein ClpS n=1 Tax=Nostocoides japonicum T1-X7 TaxID=1194083 RepID=A0A077M3Q6_9MICO|nr:DUF2017 family protein [Tetrasphaera japonica]CCH78770.1 ATP-dependent Clp protease adaptor protein ClpS [Tetrasphaera japonica T1-X7]
MAKGFRRKGRGSRARYAAQLDAVERRLLVTLLGQVATLLDPDGSISEGRSAPGAAVAETTFDQIVAGLGGGPGGPAGDESASHTGVRPDHDDPAVARLLPSGNVADEEAAAEFRRFTEDSLRRRKVAGLRRAMAVLGGADDRLELGRDDALALLVALTDVRLVLASRLGLETDEDAERLHEVALRDDTDEQAAQAAAVYDFLTWLQETLASCLTP